MHGFLVGLAGGGGHHLRQFQRVGARLFVVHATRGYHGRAGLAIPEAELAEVAAAGIL